MSGHCLTKSEFIRHCIGHGNMMLMWSPESDAFQHDLADLRGCGDLAHVCVQLLQRGREGQVSPCSSASQHVNNVLWLAAARAFVMILIPASKFHFSDTTESRGMFQKPPFFPKGSFDIAAAQASQCIEVINSGGRLCFRCQYAVERAAKV